MSHPSVPGPTYQHVLQPVNAPPQQPNQNQAQNQSGGVRFAGAQIRSGYGGPNARIIVQHPSGRPPQRYMQPGPRTTMVPRSSYAPRPEPRDGGAPMDQPVDTKLISKSKLALLARDVDPNTILEDEVIDFLLKLSEDFIDTVVTGSCALAKHRKSPTLDTADIKLCLSQQWDLQIPGFAIEDHKLKKQQTGEAHKQRLQLIRKQLKR